MKHYVLGPDKEPVETDLITWAKWFEDVTNRRVGTDYMPSASVSTVFLGIDHSFGEEEGPLLFETLVSYKNGDEEMYRCKTWAEAELQHKRALIRVIEKEDDE
jgi:hypothetical protein